MDLNDMVTRIETQLTPLFDLMGIAEEEIEAAQKRFHEPVGKGDGPIWNSFNLLVPTESVMTEKLYRAHVQELLDRVGDGEDTRPATKAEMLGVLAIMSQEAPLPPSATGLYFKLMSHLFPEFADEVLEETNRTVGDYERLHGFEMREQEEFLRLKLYVDWRTNNGS